eukprot:1157915-Pelagomonas_calceolata.AAC.1
MHFVRQLAEYEAFIQSHRANVSMVHLPADRGRKHLQGNVDEIGSGGIHKWNDTGKMPIERRQFRYPIYGILLISSFTTPTFGICSPSRVDHRLLTSLATSCMVVDFQGQEGPMMEDGEYKTKVASYAPAYSEPIIQGANQQYFSRRALGTEPNETYRRTTRHIPPPPIIER